MYDDQLIKPRTYDKTDIQACIDRRCSRMSCPPILMPMSDSVTYHLSRLEQFDKPEVTSRLCLQLGIFQYCVDNNISHPWNPNSPLRIPFRVLSFSQAYVPLTGTNFQRRENGCHERYLLSSTANNQWKWNSNQMFINAHCSYTWLTQHLLVRSEGTACLELEVGITQRYITLTGWAYNSCSWLSFII